MKRNLSIIIPSMRPHQLIECIRSIENDPQKVDCEIIVIVPIDLWDGFKELRYRDNVVLLSEKEPHGVVRAVNRGMQYASGEYVCTLSDECRVQHGWARNMIDFLEREGADATLGNFRVFEHGETQEFYYYEKKFSIFPFCHKSLLQTIHGNFFDERYYSFYADPDLGLRVQISGGNVLTCDDAFIFHPYIRDENNERNRSLYESKDHATFRDRWDKEFSGKVFYAENKWTKGSVYEDGKETKKAQTVTGRS